MTKPSARRGEEEVIATTTARDGVLESDDPARSYLLTDDAGCQGDRSSDRSPTSRAIDLLERQACNCFPKIQCLRCELLDLLQPEQQTLFA